MNISEIVSRAHENAVKKGFWDPAPEFGTAIALIHSELSEALEEARAGRPNIYFDVCANIAGPEYCGKCGRDGKLFVPKGDHGASFCGRKPEGVAVELADAVIRIADLCGHMGIDLEAAIDLKMAYNETRPFTHGKKF